jgi:hypothetical protein
MLPTTSVEETGTLLPKLALPEFRDIAGLLDKTVHVSFAIGRPGKGEDGSTINTPRRVAVTIYISSAGRIFATLAQRAGRTGARDTAYDPGASAGRCSFAGATLIGTGHSFNAATQIRVSFDGSFQSCSVEVLSGGENGAPVVWTGLNGIKYTATGPVAISAQSCSVQSGNAFAN